MSRAVVLFVIFADIVSADRGGERMDINWTEMAFQVPVVIALVTLVKKLTNDKLGQYYMLIAMGFAFAIVYLGMADSFVLLNFIRQSILVGLSAAGVYNVANKIGTGN